MKKQQKKGWKYFPAMQHAKEKNMLEDIYIYIYIYMEENNG